MASKDSTRYPLLEDNEDEEPSINDRHWKGESSFISRRQLILPYLIHLVVFFAYITFFIVFSIKEPLSDEGCTGRLSTWCKLCGGIYVVDILSPAVFG
jgi:hypothetical protein